jgi:hypothetical protein
VSAVEGAGRADVIELLRRSDHGFEVVEARAAMSGPNARAQVVRALIGLCAQGVEVILMAGGGGARSDLAAFDSPEVARAVTQCRVPMLTPSATPPTARVRPRGPRRLPDAVGGRGRACRDRKLMANGPHSW